MFTYNVIDDMISLRSLFDDFFNDRVSRENRNEFPAVRIHEGDEQITIRALVPGIKAEDIDIQLVDNTLLISGEKKNDYRDQPYIRRERTFGEFRKSIKLPYKVDSGRVSADLKEGVLTVTLVKSEDAKPKKIEIR